MDRVARKERVLRIALLSDIHANLEALNACVTHARGNGAARFAFLGDFMGYGADPRAVVEIIARHVADGAIAVKGNHDQAVEKASGYFNHDARAAIDWARASLTDEQKRFLAALPLVARDGDLCFVHASTASPARWDYVDTPTEAGRCIGVTDAVYTFCGHLHDQVLYFDAGERRMREFRPIPGTPIPVREHRHWLAIVGTVGQPRDRNPAAAYTLFDRDRQEITFFRVAYDARAAAGKIRSCGLPESLAYRVEQGI
jgi:diadenosine tetraphosphatase ApaH/serine/threonine PP2A family protein phosphatase